MGGTGIKTEKNWSRKKVPVLEQIGPAKSTGTRKICSPKEVSVPGKFGPGKSTGAEKILGTHSAFCHVVLLYGVAELLLRFKLVLQNNAELLCLQE